MQNYVNIKKPVLFTQKFIYRTILRIYKLNFVAPNINVCSRNDPNVAKCIIASIYTLQPRLATGDLAGAEFKIPVHLFSLL